MLGYEGGEREINTLIFKDKTDQYLSEPFVKNDSYPESPENNGPINSIQASIMPTRIVD
jgi:hypothetical protein